MAQQQQFGMFGPSNDPWAETFANIDRQAGMDTMQTIGSLAGRGTAQLMGGFGFKPAAVQRQEQINEAMKAARDPGGDMLTTYKNLAHELHSRGLVEEAMKAEQMYSDAQQRKQKFALDQENIQSLIRQRQAHEETRRMLANSKIGDKPWGAQAMKLYENNMAKFDPASWKKWFDELQRTNGDFQAAAATLKNIDKKVTYGPIVKDPATGRMGQWGSDGSFRPKDTQGTTVNVDMSGMKLGAQPDFLGDLQKITTTALGPKFEEDAKAFTQAKDLYETVVANPNSMTASAAFQALENAWARTNRTDSQVSQKEMAALKSGAFGSIGQRLATQGTKWLSGQPTAEVMKAYGILLQARDAALRSVAADVRTRLDPVKARMKQQGAPEEYLNFGGAAANYGLNAPAWTPADPYAANKAAAPKEQPPAGALPPGVRLRAVR